MRFIVLGPMMIVGPAGRVHLRARRQQVVLGLLLLEANRPVSVSRLIDAVWSTAPPSTARGQIQTCVSALRRSLLAAGLAHRITSGPTGYLLRVEEDELDLHRFDALVAAARAAVTAGRLVEGMDGFAAALGLWRGEEPFGGPGGDGIGALVRTLLERRLNVIEEYHAVGLSLGRHRELVDQLMELVARHPLRGRLRHQLITALHRCGQPGAALSAYRDARRTWVGELGIEPDADLVELQRAILRSATPTVFDPQPPEPVIPVPRRVGAPASPGTAPIDMLPADDACLIGRDDQIADVLRRFDEPADRLTVVVLSGRSGTGTSALAVHAAHRLAARFPDGRLYLRLTGERGEPRAPRPMLVELLESLGCADAERDHDADTADLAARFRRALTGRRTLLVLDGAVDRAQVLPLLPGANGCGVLVASHGRLTGLAGGAVLDVGTLLERHSIELLISLVGRDRIAAEPTAAFELVALCGGLPLAIRIAGERLAARPHWAVAELVRRLADDRRRLGELRHGGLDVRDGLVASHRRVGPQAQRLFRRLALIPSPDFPAWVAAPLLDENEQGARDGLERLVEAHLVRVGPGTGVSARYTLPPLGDCFARELLGRRESPAQRSGAVGRLLGGWLFLAEQAHRRAFGAALPLINGTAARWVLPGGLVEEVLLDPLRWFDTERVSLRCGITQAATLGLTELSWDLAGTLAGYYQARHQVTDWRGTHEAALSACRRDGNRRGEAAVLYSLSLLDLAEQRYDEAAGRLALARCAFEDVAEPDGRALCLRGAAFLSRLSMIEPRVVVGPVGR